MQPLDRVSIAIFAKAPIAGFVKTRLIPRLGADGAAALQQRLIEQTVRVACEVELAQVVLWCTPDCGHDVFKSLAARYPITLETQSGADLGARMHRAILAGAEAGPVLLIGTDCAVLTVEVLSRAAELFRAGADAVIVPVEDGGYVLIGLKRPTPELFAGIAWGRSTVMGETRARAREAGIRLEELPVLWDIDRVEDYERAVAGGYL